MTLRTRLLLSYVLIIVVCLGIATLSVSMVLRSYRDQVVMTRLEDLTRPVITQLRSMLRAQTSIMTVWNNIQEQAQRNNIFVLVVDDKGNVVRQASPDGSAPQISVAGGLPHDFPQESRGLFTTTSGQDFVYTAFALNRAAEPSSRADAVILCQPRSGLGVIIAGVITPFILAALIAVIVSFLLAFLVARSVYNPVKRLSGAAESISHGRYDEKVAISGPPEIKRLAENFNFMADKVKESQQHLRHFVADVSHQLKSPLTSIQGFAEAIQDGTAGDDETRSKASRIIVDESKRMLRQVNELLELSRMQSGQVKMARETVDLKEALQRCQEIFSLRLEDKKIKIHTQVDTVPFVTGDIDRLEDVFCNLLDNAIKNAPTQGEIRITTSSRSETWIAVTIADNGPGIPPEQIPHVFDRFQQTSGLRSGFGLGLAIANEIILAHGGHIEVASTPGEGAQFSVVLPFSK